MEKQVVILGAGPAGLTAAYELAKRGIRSTILEADNVVGGLARTETYKGYRFDIGGHRFFTKERQVNQIWHDVLGSDFRPVPRLSRIYYRGKYYYYPIRLLNAFLGLGLVNSIWITLSYLRARLFPSLPEESFEDFVSNRFGRRLYFIFFKTYTEKVWGIPSKEIRAEWAAQRIRGLSFTSAVLNALFKPERQNIRTLIEKFEYPRLGPGMMWDAVKEFVQAHGARVILDSPVVRVNRLGARVESVTLSRFGREDQVSGTHFISTLPLRDLIRCINPPPPDDVSLAADGLKYRDFMTVLLIINRRDLFPDNWIYVHTPRVRVGRIQNFKNWSLDMVPDPQMTSLGMEYFVSEGDDLWTMPDSELIDLAKQELEFLKLASANDVVDGTVKRMRKAYPVYDSTYRENLNVVRGYLDSFENLQTVGRNGMHKYNNQDHSMMTALLAAGNICGEKNFVWNVNTGMEYQEEIRIYSAKDAQVSDAPTTDSN